MLLNIMTNNLKFPIFNFILMIITDIYLKKKQVNYYTLATINTVYYIMYIRYTI